MFVHIWRMRARKKRVEDYEKFGRQVTLPSLRKIDGCLGAHFVKLDPARKPEYLWLVFWTDHQALDQARAHPLWREQIKRFEAGNYYKSIPQEFVCETVESFTADMATPKRITNPAKPAKTVKTPKGAQPKKSRPKKSKSEEPAPAGASPEADSEPTAKGE
jgi:quinol monooxygenase YgiN